MHIDINFFIGRPPRMTTSDQVDIYLTHAERVQLSRGLLEWSGPARCTSELARAMGFQSLEDLWEASVRLADQLNGEASIGRLD
jgi:hypothetical protein